MKKTYLKPEIDMISLITDERIATDSVDGSIGVGDNVYFPTTN